MPPNGSAELPGSRRVSWRAGIDGDEALRDQLLVEEIVCEPSQNAATAVVWEANMKSDIPRLAYDCGFDIGFERAVSVDESRELAMQLLQESR